MIWMNKVAELITDGAAGRIKYRYRKAFLGDQENHLQTTEGNSFPLCC